MTVTFRSPSGDEERVAVRPGACKDVAIELGLCSLPLDAFDIYRGAENVGNRPMAEFAGCTLVIVERRRPGREAAQDVSRRPAVADTTRRRPEASPGVAAHRGSPQSADWRQVGRALSILAFLGLLASASVLYVMRQRARQELERAEYEKRQAAAFRPAATGAWVGMVGHWPARLTIRGEGPAAGTLVYGGTGKKIALEIFADKAEGPLGVRLRGLRATGTVDPTRGEMRGRIDQGGAQQDWYLFRCVRPDALVSGTWKGQWERNTEGLIILDPFAASRIAFTLSLEQDGDRIVGSVAYDGRKGRSAIDGWVCGRRLVFGYSYADRVRNECFGTLSGDGQSFQGFWAQQGGFGSWRMTRPAE